MFFIFSLMMNERYAFRVMIAIISVGLDWKQTAMKKLENQFAPIFILFAITLWIEYSLIHIYPDQQYLQSLRFQQKDAELKSGNLNLKQPDLNFEQRSEHFHLQNARKYLQELTTFGPRVTGSEITEKEIPEWLVTTVHQIEKEHANSEMKIEIDTQRPSSNFYLDFLGGMHNVR
jgi:hypothetical protein